MDLYNIEFYIMKVSILDFIYVFRTLVGTLKLVMDMETY